MSISVCKITIHPIMIIAIPTRLHTLYLYSVVSDPNNLYPLSDYFVVDVTTSTFVTSIVK